MKSLGVYIHIPFCISRCYYCDFISSVLKDENDIKKYVEYINKEIKIASQKINFKEYKIDSVYFGGGTPILLKTDYFRSILENICLYMGKIDGEVTIEANPALIDYDKLLEFKKYGLNRISIGVQSLNDMSLKSVGRIHNSSDAIASIKCAVSCGLNVSTDLMIGLPYQTKEDIKLYIDSIVNLGVKHISTYMLQIEDGTKLKYLIDNNKIKVKNDDEKIDLFDYAKSLLFAHNFIRYEISNFAVKGYESKHNLKYWNMDDYIGIGISAHSKINNYRFYNPSNFLDYYSALDKDILPLIDEELLTKYDEFEEYIMLRLRTNKGIDINYINDYFNIDFLKKYKNKLEKLSNYLNIDNNFISIKDEYLNVMNKIVVDFLS